MIEPVSPSFRWASSYLTPYAGRVAALALLSTAEIALRVLSPWPVKAIVDSVFGATPLPGWFVTVAAWMPGFTQSRPAHLLAAIVAAGLVLQIAHQLVLMAHGRLQLATSLRLITHLRAKLFTHLQGLELAHHVRMPTGDAVHRLEGDTTSALYRQMSQRLSAPGGEAGVRSGARPKAAAWTGNHLS